MQRELFHIMFGKFIQRFRYTGPLRGGRDADVALGENEFETPGFAGPSFNQGVGS